MLKKNKIAVWLPGKRSQGLGHFYRNQWIFESSQSSEVFFNEEPEYQIGFRSSVCISNNSLEIENFLIKSGFSVLFIDNYFVSAEILDFFENSGKLKIIYFDYLFEGRNFTALLNSNPFASPERYNKQVSSILFLGADYYGFRNEIRSFSGAKKNPDQIFIAFGGSDVKKLSFQVLDKLQNSFQYQICLGKGCKTDYFEKVTKRFEDLGLKGKVHWDAENYIEMLAESSKAILTSSTSTYEAEFFQIPYVCFKVVENQDLLAEALTKKGIQVLNPDEGIPQYSGMRFSLAGFGFGQKCADFLNYMENL